VLPPHCPPLAPHCPLVCVLPPQIAEPCGRQVDPPRAGLDAATEALLPEFERVVYVSCNPATLEANLRPLLATHALRRFAVFDQARARRPGPCRRRPCQTAPAARPRWAGAVDALQGMRKGRP